MHNRPPPLTTPRDVNAGPAACGILPAAPRIGTLQLSSPLLLAPMSGRTDVAFRLRLRALGGVGLAFTDLTNPRGALDRNLRTRQILATCEADRPLGVQIYGAEEALMAEAARRIEGEMSPAVIDINMGCPAWKVVRKGGGAALMENPAAATRIFEAVAAAVRCPVTAKMRLGPSADRHTAPELARMLRQAGVAALTVHGRTTQQLYTGQVDLTGIRAVVESVPGLPVFANGNIFDHATAAQAIRATGAAGLAIGRAAIHDPWVFRRILAEDAGRSEPGPGIAQRVEFMLEHFRGMVGIYGPPRACRRLRKWASHYGHAIGMTREQRTRLLCICSPEEVEALAGEMLSEARDSRPDRS